MRALDLFCGAGGASVGLARAGFHVVGVDVASQPNYPFPCWMEDAFYRAERNDADFIWASPPCQGRTAYRRRHGHVKPVDTDGGIERIRRILMRAGKPFVIENVPSAPLRHPVTLCGSMFGLDVQRHRCFEAYGFTIPPLACDHSVWTPRFPPATNRRNLRKTVEVGVWRIPLDVQRAAMGIDWMTREELSQAIPPAYAEWIGRAAKITLTNANRS